MGEAKNESSAKARTLSGLLCLPHGGAIASILFEDWMDDSDKAEFITALEEQTGVTMEQLNGEIQTGVDNGYSVDVQMQILAKALKA